MSGINSFLKYLIYSFIIPFLIVACAEKVNKVQITDEVDSINAPFEMQHIIPPVFPDKVYHLKNFGGIPDGVTNNAKAFQKIIEKCADKGGGTIVVTNGKWYTGPINLRSNINLHLEEGAEIIFSDHVKDY